MRCALCCGDTAIRVRHILLLKREAERISKATLKPIVEFATTTEGHDPYGYEMRKTTDEGKCIFLEYKRCTIYAHKPIICRFYPFELRLTDKRKQEFRYTDECPGIDKGEKKLKKDYFENLLWLL